MYASKEFSDFVSSIRKANTPSDVIEAWDLLQSPYSSLRVITVLSEYPKNVIFPGLDIRDLSGNLVVTPYFLSSSLYFSSRKIIESIFEGKEVKIALDGSIMLDSNIASYISTYMNRKSFGDNQAEIVNLIHQLLEKNPNFDYLYYLVENSKKFIDKYDVAYKPDVDELWSSLDIGFKENLISLRQFLSIDNQKFKATNNDNPTISRTDAESKAKALTHDFYFGQEGIRTFEDTKRRFTLARILLYKMASINFSTNEGFKKKSLKFLQFMIEELNMYFDREMYVAIRYFKEGKKFSFFEKIDKDKRIPLNVLKDRIGNMSWDLMIPRFIESLSANFGNGQYFIPHYLTWDGGLKESLNMYKAKACIYDDNLGQVVTISEVNTEAMMRETVGDYYAERYFNMKDVTLRYKSEPLSNDKLMTLLENVESEFFSIIHM